MTCLIPAKLRLLALVACGLLCASASSSLSADLVLDSRWSALASDARARGVGDALTVIVIEDARASNSDRAALLRDRKLAGRIEGPVTKKAGQLSLEGRSNGSDQAAKSSQILAQIGARIDHLLDNGDFYVKGEKTIEINGRMSRIMVSGAVRPEDINADNVVYSNSMTDVSITYGGEYKRHHGGPLGLVSNLLNIFGLQ